MGDINVDMNSIQLDPQPTSHSGTSQQNVQMLQQQHPHLHGEHSLRISHMQFPQSNQMKSIPYSYMPNAHQQPNLNRQNRQQMINPPYSSNMMVYDQSQLSQQQQYYKNQTGHNIVNPPFSNSSAVLAEQVVFNQNSGNFNSYTSNPHNSMGDYFSPNQKQIPNTQNGLPMPTLTKSQSEQVQTHGKHAGYGNNNFTNFGKNQSRVYKEEYFTKSHHLQDQDENGSSVNMNLMNLGGQNHNNFKKTGSYSAPQQYANSSQYQQQNQQQNSSQSSASQEQRKLKISEFKVNQCTKKEKHEKKKCPYYHNDGDRRRCPETYQYSFNECTKKDKCPLKDDCPQVHNKVEQLYHPLRYKAKFCQSYKENNQKCEYGNYCSFAHLESEIVIPMICKLERDAIFYMYFYKTVWCPNTQSHERANCPYMHNVQDFRRDPKQQVIEPRQCEQWKKTNISKYSEGECPQQLKCRNCHGWKEHDYHPQVYKTKLCNIENCPQNLECVLYHSDKDRRVVTSTLLAQEGELATERLKNLIKNSNVPYDVKLGAPIDVFYTEMEEKMNSQSNNSSANTSSYSYNSNNYNDGHNSNQGSSHNHNSNNNLSNNNNNNMQHQKNRVKSNTMNLNQQNSSYPQNRQQSNSQSGNNSQGQYNNYHKVHNHNQNYKNQDQKHMNNYNHNPHNHNNNNNRQGKNHQQYSQGNNHNNMANNNNNHNNHNNNYMGNNNNNNNSNNNKMNNYVNNNYNQQYHGPKMHPKQNMNNQNSQQPSISESNLTISNNRENQVQGGFNNSNNTNNNLSNNNYSNNQLFSTNPNQHYFPTFQHQSLSFNTFNQSDGTNTDYTTSQYNQSGQSRESSVGKDDDQKTIIQGNPNNNLMLEDIMIRYINQDQIQSRKNSNSELQKYFVKKSQSELYDILLQNKYNDDEILRLAYNDNCQLPFLNDNQKKTLQNILDHYNDDLEFKDIQNLGKIFFEIND